MPLVFAGITPHTPLLVPQIAKDRADIVEETNQALSTLAESLYATHPDIVIVISAYTGVFEHAFSLNAHTTLVSDFSKFGDLSVQKKWNGAPAFAALVSKKARTNKEKVRLVSDEIVDHGISVPLLTLTARLPKVTILPVGPSMLERSEHLKFGELIKEVIFEQHKRVAVIVSGHLSHKEHDNELRTKNKYGEEFDKALLGYLEQRNTTALITMNEEMVKGADELIYKSLLILLGIIRNSDYTFKTYCYEAPLGVGYLTGNFNI